MHNTVIWVVGVGAIQVDPGVAFLPGLVNVQSAKRLSRALRISVMLRLSLPGGLFSPSQMFLIQFAIFCGNPVLYEQIAIVQKQFLKNLGRLNFYVGLTFQFLWV